MQWTIYRVMLALVMLTTGSLNTLFGKWADRQVVEGTPGWGERQFNHPFFQAVFMFIGEMLCGFVFLVMMCIRRRKGQPEETIGLGNMTFNFKEIFSKKGALARSPLVFFPPAMCDVTATSIMFIALNYTTAASYQMLRGAVIIFTALLSVAFLNRKISGQMWIGILAVLGGLVIVGASDFIFNPDNSVPLTMVITGDELVVLAQIIAACQMVYEERFVTKLDCNPLLVVGLEGVYGFVVLGLLTIPMYWIYVGQQFSTCPFWRLEDDIDAFYMMANSWQVSVAMVGMILSIAFFNWAGVSVTKELSATTRMVLDSCRTLVIWGATLALGWQIFEWLQVIGFIVLTTGIFIYNDILNVKSATYMATCKCFRKKEDDMEALVDDTSHDQ